MKSRFFVLGFLGLAGFLFLHQGFLPHWTDIAEQAPHSIQSTSGRAGAPLVDVIVPELSAAAQAGKKQFEVSCVACHGANAAGKEGVAPPLVHIIYETNHHGDNSFYQAVRYGVRAHHWRFGNMPAIKGVSPSQVADIITYIRELQRANSIF